MKSQAKSLQRVCPNIFNGYKRKHCSSTDRCLARKNDEGKGKDDETSEKNNIPLYFLNNIAKKAVEHEGQHRQMELTANMNTEEDVWDLLWIHVCRWNVNMYKGKPQWALPFEQKIRKQKHTYAAAFQWGVWYVAFRNNRHLPRGKQNVPGAHIWGVFAYI